MSQEPASSRRGTGGAWGAKPPRTNIDTTVERSRILPHQPTTLGWVVRASGGEQARRRVPLNLSLVIDVSGSMGGGKLARAQEAATWILSQLGPQDTVSVVSFASDVRVVVPATTMLDARLEVIAGAVAGLSAHGGTNLSGGWSEGVYQVQRRHQAGAANRVILLTDGAANQGVTQPVKLCGMVRQAGQDGAQPVSTSTVGVGAGFEEDLLLAMAKEGRGAFHYAADAGGIADSFADELTTAGQLIAQNVTLELRPAPGVQQIRQLSGHPATWDAQERLLTIRLGDVSAGTYRQAGVEFVVDDCAATAELPVLSGVVRWLDLGEEGACHREQRLRASVAVDPELEAPDPAVVHELAVLRLGRARRKALRHADAGRIDLALGVLTLARAAAGQSLVGADARAQEHLAGLARLERLLRHEPQSYGAGTVARKQAMTETYHAGSATIRMGCKRA